jgi:transcription-repair coupling factor (superfamily II helicase)
MDVYRKIAVAKGDEDLEQIKGELADVYGPAPDEVGLLLELAELRIKASKLGIKSIVTSNHDLVFSFAEDRGKEAESLFSTVSECSVGLAPPRFSGGLKPTLHLRLAENYFEPQTLTSLLRKILGGNRLVKQEVDSAN